MLLSADRGVPEQAGEGRWPRLGRFLARPVGWWTTLGIVCGLLVAPLLITDLPPVGDYPNHLARFFILAHAQSDPVLGRIWQADWHVIPDLGLDLVMPPLMLVFGTYCVGKLALAVALLAPMLGAVAYSRAAFGERLYWPMSASLVAYNLFFVLGFINYLIAAGVALAAAALWIVVRRRPLALRAVAGALCACTLFFLHLFGVVYFGVLVFATELADLWATRRREGAIISKAAAAVVLLLASFAGPAALWLAVPRSPHPLAYGWSFLLKLVFLASPFMTYEAWPGAVVGAVFVAVVATYLLRGAIPATGLPIAMLALLLVYFCVPYAFGGGEYVDSRVPLLLALTLTAGLRPSNLDVARLGWAAMAMSSALLIALASVARVWGLHNAQAAQVEASIAAVPPGSRVLVSTPPFAWDNPYWEKVPSSVLALGLIRIDYHLAALLAIERRAFWPLLFSDPSQHPIRVLPPYAAISDTAGILPDLRSLERQHSDDPRWPRHYLKEWPDHFDYVLVLDAGAADNLAQFLPDKLTLVNQSGFTALFRVRPRRAGAGR